MKVIGSSSKEQAVLEWLRAEMNSDRFSDDLHTALKELGCDDEIVIKARLDDEQDNLLRWRILKSYRAWLDRNFDDYDWKKIELNKDDVNNLKYIDYSYWNELSDNTRTVGRAAKNVSNGKTVFDVPNDRFYSVAKDVENGTSLPPIIVVSNHYDNQCEILEGHLRATGFALAKVTERPLTAIWGTLKY